MVFLELYLITRHQIECESRGAGATHSFSSLSYAHVVEGIDTSRYWGGARIKVTESNQENTGDKFQA